MKDSVSLLEYLSDNKDISSMTINELLMRDNYTGEEVEKPCIIFKEFKRKISEFKTKEKIDTKYSFFRLNRAWLMLTAIRLGDNPVNTYLNIYNLNYKENIELLKKLNTVKDMSIVFYNENMEIQQSMDMKNNPFYHNLNVVIKELEKDTIYDSQRCNDFIELKRLVLNKFNNDGRVFFDSIK